MQSGFITDSTSVTSKAWRLDGAALSAMKLFASDAISSALNLPVGYDENIKGMVILSSLMRCSLRFAGSRIICSGPLIKMVK